MRPLPSSARWALRHRARRRQPHPRRRLVPRRRGRKQGGSTDNTNVTLELDGEPMITISPDEESVEPARDVVHLAKVSTEETRAG